MVVYGYAQKLLAVFLVALFSPVILFSAGILVLTHKENPFFIQKRIGLNGKPFSLFKLKTFYGDKPSTLGQFFRKTSIDELPQLLNVINGTMALVGPRPLMLKDIPEYGLANLARYNTVLPCITGLFQINGRKLLTMQQRAAYDLTYIQSKTFSTDIKILSSTISAVFSGVGAQ